MSDQATTTKAPRGRPPKDPNQRLVPYGLHLSRDKKFKMIVVKDVRGDTVRDYVEESIERDYQKLVRAGKVGPEDWQKLALAADEAKAPA